MVKQTFSFSFLNITSDWKGITRKVKKRNIMEKSLISPKIPKTDLSDVFFFFKKRRLVTTFCLASIRIY